MHKVTQKSGYTIHGKGETVILLHSSMSSKSQWQKLISDLKPVFRIITIDLLGYGDCSFPVNPEQFSLKDETNRIETIIENEVLSKESIHLVGHSYGGAVSLKLAYKLPMKIKSLILYEPVAFHLLQNTEPAMNDIKMLVDKINLSLEQSDVRAATELFIDYWSGKGYFKMLPKRIQAAFIQEIHKVVLDFKALTEEACTLQDYLEITSPTCLIAGMESPVSSRRITELLRQTLPNLSFFLTEGGHMAPITHTASINPIIMSFLNPKGSD